MYYRLYIKCYITYTIYDIIYVLCVYIYMYTRILHYYIQYYINCRTLPRIICSMAYLRPGVRYCGAVGAVTVAMLQRKPDSCIPCHAGVYIPRNSPAMTSGGIKVQGLLQKFKVIFWGGGRALLEVKRVRCEL